MPGMLRDLKAAREVVGTEDVAPILAQFLKRACLALDRDALTARQEIQVRWSCSPMPRSRQRSSQVIITVGVADLRLGKCAG